MVVGGGRRVVVTGVGLVSPLGADVDRFWQALIEQRSGITRLNRFDPTSYVCQVAGQIDDELFSDRVHPRKLRNASRASQLGLAATALALDDATWADHRYPPERVATVIGTAMGGWIDSEKQYGILLERGARRVNPFVINASPPNGPAGEVATLVGARGPQLTFCGGCPASVLAIGHAADLIQKGDVDAAIVGGVEAPISPLVFAGMGRTNELSRQLDPSAACRPFDARHDGMVLSEGACMLVLEAEHDASARGIRPWARVLGHSSSCDAEGLFDLDLSGTAAAAAAHNALTHAGIEPAQIDYVCAHANGSPAFDQKEVAVIRKVFRDHAEAVPVSSIKGVLGHPFGAAGAFQLATAQLAIRHRLIPPTANLVEVAQGCELRHVRNAALPAEISHALITSYGYGGVNAALVIGRP